ncbi:MAG TPA: cation:proton antiporter [Desulfobacteraceae bacterium]|nr:cation:proton antiporter [Desulfobacteraceae bacterium]
MTVLQNILSVLLICLGIFFMLVGSIGILRLPDFYSRTHAVSMSDALGISSVMLGLIVYEGFTQSSLKLLLIVLFVALSNPIGSHALSRAAFKNKVEPLLTGRKQVEVK